MLTPLRSTSFRSAMRACHPTPSVNPPASVTRGRRPRFTGRPAVRDPARGRPVTPTSSRRRPMPAPSTPTAARRPTLRELGTDLTRVSVVRRGVSLAGPFLWCGAYWAAAALGWWAAAVGCTVALSFVTYGSVSHDLVHRTLRLPRRASDALLTVIELLALRSGTAYRLAHLHHHRRYPADDDVEGAAAGMTLPRALLEGLIFHPKLFAWAWREHPALRPRLALEGGLILAAYAAAAAALPWTAAPAIYAGLLTAGAWVIPLATSYLPHDPAAEGEVRQTRAFRGAVCSAVALGHLYHLEHHLYPAVPHHNWPELARRLDPHLAAEGVEPVRLWF